MSTAKAVLEMAKKRGVKMVDVKFVDTFGTWQHFTVPAGELTEEVFEDGFGFDGSSIRGSRLPSRPPKGRWGRLVLRHSDGVCYRP